MSVSSKIALREGEEIITLARSHIIIHLWKCLLGALCMGTAAFFAFNLLARGWWGYALFGLGVFIGVYLIFSAWFFYYFNYLVITSLRIVDINRVGWFDEIVSAAGYGDIKDIFIRKRGVFANLFNYGILAVETKSQQTVIEIDNLANPAGMQTLIFELSEKYAEEKQLANLEAVYYNFLQLVDKFSRTQLNQIKEMVEEQLVIATQTAEEDNSETENITA